MQTTLVNIDKNMGDIPRLIYDGPFADEMVNRKAVGLSGENISREEAERKVREFLAAIGLETLVPLKKEKILKR